MGNNATSVATAVISIGRRRCAPLDDRLKQLPAITPVLVDQADEHDRVGHHDPDQHQHADQHRNNSSLRGWSSSTALPAIGEMSAHKHRLNIELMGLVY